MHPPPVSPVWLRQAQALDQALLLKINGLDHPALGWLMRGLTKLGDTSSWFVIGVALLVAGGTVHQLGQRLAVAALSGALLAQILKRFAMRSRPSHTNPSVRVRCRVPACSSFPSGHTLTAFSIAMALGGLDSWVGVTATILAAGIGTSRVFLGAHYPADVTAGAVLGSVWGAIIAVVWGPMPL